MAGPNGPIGYRHTEQMTTPPPARAYAARW